MKKLIISSILLFIILLFGKAVLEMPRILIGKNVTSFTVEKGKEARLLALERGWNVDINGLDAGMYQMYVRNRSDNLDLIGSNINLNFSIRIMILTFILLSIKRTFSEQNKQIAPLFSGIIATVGFLFAIYIGLVTKISGDFYFAYTVGVVLLLSSQNGSISNLRLLTVTLLSISLYASLDPLNIAIVRSDLKYSLLLEAHLGTVFSTGLGLISHSLYFLAPLFFIKINISNFDKWD